MGFVTGSPKEPEIPLATFVHIAPKAVVILEDQIEKIHERLEARDHIAYDLQLIAELQLRERSHAQRVCNTLNVPLLIREPSHDLKDALSFVEANVRILGGQR